MKRNASMSQRGIAQIAVIAAIIVIAAIGGIGYVVMSRNKDTNSANDSNKAATNNEIEAECRKFTDDKDLCKFASNWSDMGNFSTTVVTEDKDGKSTMKIENADKNTSRVVTTKDGKDVGEIITTKDAIYIKDQDDGKWTKMPNDMSDDGNEINDVDFKFEDDPKTPEKEDATAYKKIGKEACGSLSCFKYQYVDPTKPGDESYFWFDDKEYLPRRWTYKDKEGTVDMIYDYTKVSISIPTDVKEMPNLQNMTQEQLEEYMRQNLPATE